jgi:hypothetical protein
MHGLVKVCSLFRGKAFLFISILTKKRPGCAVQACVRDGRTVTWLSEDL